MGKETAGVLPVVATIAYILDIEPDHWLVAALVVVAAAVANQRGLAVAASRLAAEEAEPEDSASAVFVHASAALVHADARPAPVEFYVLVLETQRTSS